MCTEILKLTLRRGILHKFSDPQTGILLCSALALRIDWASKSFILQPCTFNLLECLAERVGDSDLALCQCCRRGRPQVSESGLLYPASGAMCQALKQRGRSSLVDTGCFTHCGKSFFSTSLQRPEGISGLKSQSFSFYPIAEFYLRPESRAPQTSACNA